MKQKIALLCLFSLLIFPLSAQKIGIKAGLNMAKGQYDYTGTSLSTSNLMGFHAGIIGEVSLTDALYFNTGALVSQKGTKFSIIGVNVDFPITYVEVPLNIAYKYDLGAAKIFGQVGPYAGFGLSAKMKGGGEEEEMEFGSEEDQLKRIDFGVNIGAGVEIKSIQLGVTYGLGLANISNSSDETMKNGVISISAAFLFGK